MSSRNDTPDRSSGRSGGQHERETEIRVRPRNTTRGRPRTTGRLTCARCHRQAAKIRITWPDGRICGICFHDAMRHHGSCATCGERRLLPGRTDAGNPCCGDCAGITNLTCTRCGVEAEHYRKGTCARCVLDTELAQLLHPAQADRPDAGGSDGLDSQDLDASMRRLHAGMIRADRPESLITWLRAAAVRDLLARLATGQVPLTHEGLDALPAGRGVEHMRALLETYDVLAPRDHHLALFERWLDDKLATLEDRRLRQPLEQFARWHHLNRLRRGAKPGQGNRGPVHAAKQQITEVTKFLTWLQREHHRYIDDCTQLDVEDYLAQGPTTRHLIRTFFVWRTRNNLPPVIVIGHRQPSQQPVLTQDQRLAWIAAASLTSTRAAPTASPACCCCFTPSPSSRSQPCPRTTSRSPRTGRSSSWPTTRSPCLSRSPGSCWSTWRTGRTCARTTTPADGCSPHIPADDTCTPSAS